VKPEISTFGRHSFWGKVSSRHQVSERFIPKETLYVGENALVRITGRTSHFASASIKFGQEAQAPCPWWLNQRSIGAIFRLVGGDRV
jgi:hypothetical protein